MRFSATIVFVAALISVNVILLGSVTTYKTSQINLPDAYALQREVVPPGVTILIDKGNTLFNQGNYAQAIQYYDKALAVYANDKVALIGKANSLLGLRNFTQAIQYYDKALAVDPKFKEALDGKGESLSGIGSYSQAIHYYDKALPVFHLDLWYFMGALLNENVAYLKPFPSRILCKKRFQGWFHSYVLLVVHLSKCVIARSNQQHALSSEENFNLLLFGQPASSKTPFLMEIMEAREGKTVYFDATNTTNRILQVLEEERPAYRI